MVAVSAATLVACGDTLPADVEDYQSRCVQLNVDPIPPYEGDPHAGFKNVYACDVDEAQLLAGTRPFPEGTLIVKESTKEGQEAPWLVATARKGAGQGVDSWQWDEYTRNFPDEEFRRILAKQSTCTDCHKRVQDADYIFTFLASP